MTALALLLAVATAPFMPPRVASHVAAYAIGEPWVAEHLERTCHRESRCSPRVRVHKRDSWAGRSMYRNAVRVGWLDPDACVHHRRDATDSWSVSGAWGASRAYTLRHLPLECVPADVLDVPLLGAIASGRRMAQVCDDPPCSRAEIRAAWKGRRNAERATN